LYNKRGELIETEFTYSDPHTLKSGQKAPFDNFIDEKTGDKVKAFEVSLSWYNPDGTEEYIEDVEVTKDPQQKTIPIIENTKQNNENETFSFFNTDGKDIEKPGNDEDDDEEDEDNKDDKKNDKDEDDD
jgi:hypothetical protein